MTCSETKRNETERNGTRALRKTCIREPSGTTAAATLRNDDDVRHCLLLARHATTTRQAANRPYERSTPLSFSLAPSFTPLHRSSSTRFLRPFSTVPLLSLYSLLFFRSFLFFPAAFLSPLPTFPAKVFVTFLRFYPSPSPPLSPISLCSNGSRSFPSATSLLLTPSSMFSMHLPLPFCTVASLRLSPPSSLPVFSPLHFFLSLTRPISLPRSLISILIRLSLVPFCSDRRDFISFLPSLSLSLSLSFPRARMLPERDEELPKQRPTADSGGNSSMWYVYAFLACNSRTVVSARTHKHACVARTLPTY